MSTATHLCNMLHADAKRESSQLDACVAEPSAPPRVQFLFDSQRDVLTQPGVFVVISVLVHSPLLQPHGARRLVSFLNSLPHRSVIVVADSVQRHTMMAVRGRDRRKMSIEVTRQMAVQRGHLYVHAICKAMEEQNRAGIAQKIAVVRWDDVMDQNKREQHRIVRQHYMNNMLFRDPVNMMAMHFVTQRTPNSRHMSERLAHAVNYILAELSVFVSGIAHEQRRYRTLVYATSTEAFAAINANLSISLYALVHHVLTHPAFADLKKQLVQADDGVEALHAWPVVLVSPDGTATNN